MPGHVHLEGDVAQPLGQVLTDGRLQVLGRPELFAARVVHGLHVVVGHLPLDLAVEDLGPLGGQGAPPRVRVGDPVLHPLQQGPVAHREVPVQRLPRVEGEEQLDGLLEDLLHVQVHRPVGPMEIDVGVHGEARVDEAAQRGGPGLVQGQAPVGDEGIIEQPVDVHHVQRESGHVGVPLDVVHIVGGVDAGENRLQGLEPFGHLLDGPRIGLAH